MKEIFIEINGKIIKARLNDSKTAQAIWGKLPVEAKVNIWGEEIYFEIPVKSPLENGVDVVSIGDLAYWPEGNCFCIFFGMTPVSRNGQIRPASKVNLIGKVKDDLGILKTFKDGDKVTLKKGGGEC